MLNSDSHSLNQKLFPVEHFYMYLFVKPFTGITDHKPSEIIFNKPKSKPPARTERWVMRPFKLHFLVNKGQESIIQMTICHLTK